MWVWGSSIFANLQLDDADSQFLVQESQICFDVNDYGAPIISDMEAAMPGESLLLLLRKTAPDQRITEVYAILPTKYL